MSNSKTATAVTGINPKLLAIAAKLDTEYAQYKTCMSRPDTNERDDQTDAIFGKMADLERMAKVRAVSLQELAIKASYADEEPVKECIAECLS